MWSVHLFQVVTGLLGPKLQYESFDWGIELNGTESWSIKLKKSDLPNVDFDYWLAPWWAGVVFFYDNQPIVAGPILNLPHDSDTEIHLSGLGIRAVFARRKLTEEYVGSTTWSTNLPNSIIGWSGKSLGTIAKYAIQKAQMKPAGALPISYPIPDEDGTHERNYKGYNIQNINLDQILTKLSNVRNGPDVLFKPRMAAVNRLTFDFWTGTNASPRIQQFTYPIWDKTPVKSNIISMRLTTTGAYQSSRVYSLGAGVDAGTKIAVITNQAPLQKQFPLLETSVTTSKSEDLSIIKSHGIANLEVNTNALQEVEIHVRADGTNKLGTFWPGDLVKVNVKNFITLKDGVHDMRLLAMSGSNDNDVMLNLQKEEKFISTHELQSLAEEENVP